jgi:galactokinase
MENGCPFLTVPVRVSTVAAMALDGHHHVKERFAEVFGSTDGKIHIVRAPGRVNLIGEHTDYNEGLVFPIAIEADVSVVCRVRKDNQIRFASTVFPNEFVEFSLQKKIERTKAHWGNYIRGVAAELIAAGIPLSGMDSLVFNTLPVGGGLSSSAALEIAAARGMLLVAGLNMDNDRLAAICRKAEQEYAQVPVGIMDQTIVASAKAGFAMLLDCRTLAKQFIPIEPKELRIVIVNSMVKHDLTGGEYARRRHECDEAVRIVQRKHPGIKALRDVTIQQLEAARGQLSEVLFRRCRHVVTENLRTASMAEKIASQLYDDAGDLMVQSHHSLRDDYEVSCKELDFLVDESIKIKGVYGARMTGAGFGGCIVAMTQPRSVDWLTDHLHKMYTDKFGRQPQILFTSATAGASVLE